MTSRWLSARIFREYKTLWPESLATIHPVTSAVPRQCVGKLQFKPPKAASSENLPGAKGKCDAGQKAWRAHDAHAAVKLLAGLLTLLYTRLTVSSGGR